MLQGLIKLAEELKIEFDRNYISNIKKIISSNNAK